MDEDEVLNKITRLLEKGCTMLATHHDCGAPLFRCQGEVVCPVCSFPDEPGLAEKSVIKESREDEPDHERELTGAPAARENRSKTDKGKVKDDEVVEARSRLRASLIARLDELSREIILERDLDRLKRLLDCAEGLVRVLDLL